MNAIHLLTGQRRAILRDLDRAAGADSTVDRLEHLLDAAERLIAHSVLIRRHVEPLSRFGGDEPTPAPDDARLRAILEEIAGAPVNEARLVELVRRFRADVEARFVLEDARVMSALSALSAGEREALGDDMTDTLEHLRPEGRIGDALAAGARRLIRRAMSLFARATEGPSRVVRRWIGGHRQGPIESPH
jgi:hypothetical protein